MFLPLIATAVLLSMTSAKAFYDPSIGRWVNRDPLGDEGFKVTKDVFLTQNRRIKTELTLYPFVSNDPINRFDPLGLSEGILGIPGTGGGCHNKSGGPEWAVVAGKWVKLAPGQSTPWNQDCDGMTCGGGFYYISDLDGGACKTPRNDCPKYKPRRWTPSNPGPNARPPSGPGGRGGSEGNTPPDYKYD